MITRQKLDELFEVDQVVIVPEMGEVRQLKHSEATDMELFAPSCFEGDLDDSKWEIITKGHSLQDSGSVMHDSEGIHQGLADEILSRSGFYVLVSVLWQGEQHTESDEYEGWVIARYVHDD